jgi:hypothetical protein
MSICLGTNGNKRCQKCNYRWIGVARVKLLRQKRGNLPQLDPDLANLYPKLDMMCAQCEEMWRKALPKEKEKCTRKQAGKHQCPICRDGNYFDQVPRRRIADMGIVGNAKEPETQATPGKGWPKRWKR